MDAPALGFVLPSRETVTKSPGRNSLCPCGSGKKYKHCCRAIQTAQQNAPVTTPSQNQNVPASRELQANRECFRAAFRFLSEGTLDTPLSDYTLVHGNLAKFPQDKDVNHAWIESGKIVYDVSNGRPLKFLKREYYERFGVKNTRRYSSETALVATFKTGHYGPWEELAYKGQSTYAPNETTARCRAPA